MPQLEIDNASQTDSGVRRNLDAVPLGWPPQTRNNGQQVAQVAAMTTSDDNDGNGGALVSSGAFGGYKRLIPCRN